MKYKIWAYSHQDEILDLQTDSFEEALDEMRKDWQGWPRRLEMPDGSNYEFKGGEWEVPVIYYFIVLKDIKNKSAVQNYVLNSIKNKGKEFIFLLNSLKFPIKMDELFNIYKDSALYVDVTRAVAGLIECGLIELTPFSPSSGSLLDSKWRKYGL